jgi:hypothetical protein
LPNGYSEICFVDWELREEQSNGAIHDLVDVPHYSVLIVPDALEKRGGKFPLANGEYFPLNDIRIANGYECFTQAEFHQYHEVKIENQDGILFLTRYVKKFSKIRP